MSFSKTTVNLCYKNCTKIIVNLFINTKCKLTFLKRLKENNIFKNIITTFSLSKNNKNITKQLFKGI